MAGGVTNTTEFANFVSAVKLGSVQTGRSTSLPIAQAAAFLCRSPFGQTLTFAAPSAILTFIWRYISFCIFFSPGISRVVQL